MLSLFAIDSLSIQSIGILNTTLFALLSIWVLKVRLPKAGIPTWPGKPSRQDTRLAMEFAIPMLGANIQLDGDKTVLNAYDMEATAGVYGAAFRVVSLAFTPIRALQAAAHNRLLAKAEESKGLQVKRSRTFALSLIHI